MMGHGQNAGFIRCRRIDIRWVHLLVLPGLLLTACSPGAPAATQTTVAITTAETAFVSPTPVALTATIYPTSTPEMHPTLPPVPTARAKYFMGIGQPLKLIDLHMFDEQNGWAISAGRSFNYIVHTQDGGHSWKDVTPYYGYGGPVFFANGFFALDANTAWATTPEMPACSVQNFSCTIIPDTALVWHTTDGGWTWQGQFVTSLPNYYTPLSLQFLDAQTGWSLAAATTGQDFRYYLHETTDGGVHWSPVLNISNRTTPEDPHEKNITAIAFQDSHTAWMSTSEICCEAQIIKEWKIYRSTDGGITWNPFPLPAPDPLPATFSNNPAQCAVQDIQVTHSDVLDATVYCYVYEGLSKPEFYFHYHSGDGGKHWVSFQASGDVQFIDASLGWRMTPNEGAYDIERTQDGGITWTKLKTVQWNGHLHFVNQWVGWALAASGEDVALVHTEDGGRTWDQFSPVSTDR